MISEFDSKTNGQGNWLYMQVNFMHFFPSADTTCCMDESDESQ